MKRSTLALIVPAALVAAGCGGGDGDEEPVTDDTAVVTDSDGATSGGVLVDGGLSVAEALDADTAGVIAVSGFIVADKTSVRLCELLAESLPPQCGGASIVVTGVTADGLNELPDSDKLGLQTAQDVTWTNGIVSLFGEVVQGELVIDTLVSG